jgi:hypothetical protein
MQDFGQPVARTEFCPDVRGLSKQIQFKCCRPAALGRGKGPKLEQVNVPYYLRVFRPQIGPQPSDRVRGHAFAEYALARRLPQNGRLPLTADNAAGFNPEISGGMIRWQAMQT